MIGELVKNKNVVKPHFIGDSEWKKLLDQVVIKKKRKSGTLVGNDNYAHTIRASSLSTRHHLGKGGILSAKSKIVSLLQLYVSYINIIFYIFDFSNYFIVLLNCS